MIIKKIFFMLLIQISFNCNIYASHKIIVVGGNINYPPYEFLNNQGEPSGYNVELTRAIAATLGIKVKFKLGDWKVVRKALEDGKIDILQGMSYSRGRSGVVDFSIPHTMVNHSIYSRKGISPLNNLTALRGKEVAFHARGFIHNYLSEKKINVIPILTSTPAVAINRVSSGNPDYAVVASLPAAYLIKEMDIKNVSPSRESVISVKYCYSVKKGNADLLAKFNEGLAILKQTGEYQKIYDKWLGVLEPRKVTWKTIIRYGSIISAMLLLAFSGILLWSWTLRKQVSLRTAALEDEILERKKTVQKLKQKQTQLIQADRMVSLGVLVSGMAHEINNPNGLILLNMPLILDYFKDIQPIIDDHYNKDGDFSVAGLKYSRLQNKIEPKLIDIQESAKRIKRIVEDLKHFARRDESDVEYTVNLNTVSSAALRLVENKINKSTNSFITNYSKRPPLIKGNPQRIEQVIINLILNSCESLKSKEDKINLSIGHSLEEDKIYLKILDEGEGIRPENIPYITDPFFTTKREKGGTGLGLSMTAGIVKDHRGSLNFKSTPGNGTTVTISFPAYEEVKK